MDVQTHTAAGVGAFGGAAFAEKLTDLLTGWHGLTSAHASDIAWFVVSGAAIVYPVVAWAVKKRWPDAPMAPNPNP